ncbi:MAG: VOC family protein [Lachnospiraceae bacterium]
MKIDGLAHIGLFIKDAEVSERFYIDILGFQRIWRTENLGAGGTEIITFIRNGNLVLELVQSPFWQERADGWFDHIAINVEELDNVIESLKEKNISFEEGSYTIAPHIFEHGSKWVLFRGPDGEHLELNEALIKKS